MLRRFPNYEIVGDIARVGQRMTLGIKTMSVVFHR